VGRFPVAHIFFVAPSRAQLYRRAHRAPSFIIMPSRAQLHRRAHRARSFIVAPSRTQLNRLGRCIPSPHHQFHLGRSIIAAPPSSRPAHHCRAANYISASASSPCRLHLGWCIIAALSSFLSLGI
jgi:hypothetical protein